MSPLSLEISNRRRVKLFPRKKRKKKGRRVRVFEGIPPSSRVLARRGKGFDSRYEHLLLDHYRFKEAFSIVGTVYNAASMRIALDHANLSTQNSTQLPPLRKSSATSHQSPRFAIQLIINNEVDNK